jgi:hypothetical protein
MINGNPLLERVFLCLYSPAVLFAAPVKNIFHLPNPGRTSIRTYVKARFHISLRIWQTVCLWRREGGFLFNTRTPENKLTFMNQRSGSSP